MTHRNIALRATRHRGGGWSLDSRRTWRRSPGRAEAGMTTAEYAVGIMAACTFALVLLGVVRSDAVRGALAGLVQSALGIAG